MKYDWLPILFTAFATLACGEGTGEPTPPTPKTPPGKTDVRPREATPEKSVEEPKQTLPEDMLPVPGGTFTMGLEHPRAIPDESFPHQVSINGFALDKTEVTNEEYNKCVEAGICPKPREIDTVKQGFPELRYFRKPDHPVTGISQTNAAKYCQWRGKRLPTEAEFERAARGDDGRMFAWGDQFPNEELAVFSKKVTAPVGSKPKGKGPYGHFDLAGNVWEWTSDLYDPFAYTRETAKSGVPADCDAIKKTQDQLREEGKQGFTGTNPIPTDCDSVLRGGAFNYFPWGLRASNRVHHPGNWKMIMAGFRCAMDWPDE